MSEFAVLRFEKIKSRSGLVGRSYHNSRKGVVGDHIAKEKIEFNKTMGDGVKEFDRIVAGRGGVLRKNGVVAVEAVMSFSPSAKLNVEEWASASLAWLGKEFGSGNILEASLHLDEKTPHLHVLFVPIDKRGKFNWRGICGGREGMRALQSSYATSMGPFGLSRGISKIGRDHIPPAIHREIEKLKIEIEKLKVSGKENIMNKEQNMLSAVKAYLGEDKFLQFLEWLEVRNKKYKRTKALEKGLMSGKAGEDFSREGLS